MINAPATVNLDEIATDPHLADTLPRNFVTGLLTRCAVVQSVLAARLSVLDQTSNGDTPTEPSEETLTVPEVARTLKFKTAYVYEMVRRGTLPGFRTGKYVRVRRSALLAWIQENQGKTAT